MSPAAEPRLDALVPAEPQRGAALHRPQPPQGRRHRQLRAGPGPGRRHGAATEQENI